MRKYMWVFVVILGIWSISGCSRNDIVSPSVQSAVPVERDEKLLTDYWNIYGTVTNSRGQPVQNAPVYIVAHYGRTDSTVYFLVFTDSNGNYELFRQIYNDYGTTVRVKLSCKGSNPPEVVLGSPDGWGGDFYSIVDFSIDLPYCVPIME